MKHCPAAPDSATRGHLWPRMNADLRGFGGYVLILFVNLR
jgi:hypothetical protein